MTSKTDLFMNAVTAPDPRGNLKLDGILNGLDKATRTAIVGKLKDRSVSTARIRSGLAAIGITISASGIDTWRRRNVE